ncbi:SGNH hydrolase-type esterase domain-containing protein [Sordaria brevicollis]|uniref:SGNH hydrolase-type esterase domain-containing protein n=1 Tax=Sordaria brevicollis TaxID=83679 RepID=A0AAE0PCX9_SORBR|nr:SGNH hydrolase-type esterase domain-containing protein [Sordaria brevicollis]
MPAPKKLRILCFGDSLTEGYSGWGSRFTPYSAKLGEMLQMAFPDVDVEIVTDGVSGDLVTEEGTFLERAKSYFAPTNPAEFKHFDWAIVLGGTNDLGSNIHPEQIFQGLKQIYDLALSRKCKVLALTVPEIELSAGKTKELLDLRRNELNQMIKTYKKPNYYTFDLHAAFPFYAMPPADRSRYWDDSIHFTPAGYDRMGNKIGVNLVAMLVKEKSDNDRTPMGRKRRMFKDDEKVFEEEEDPSEPTSPGLDRGYIVVRRRDLD